MTSVGSLGNLNALPLNCMLLSCPTSVLSLLVIVSLILLPASKIIPNDTQVINHAYKGNYLGQLLLSFQTQKKEAGLSFSQKRYTRQWVKS